jgi:hypothetical protein
VVKARVDSCGFWGKNSDSVCHFHPIVIFVGWMGQKASVYSEKKIMKIKKFYDLVFRCNEVQDSYYVPTLYQYQFEIEDGYRRDGSPVRIGYDDTRCQCYKTFFLATAVTAK